MPATELYNPGSFCWFELATTDLAAAKQFYMSLFGWSVNDMSMGPEEVYSMFQLEGKDVGAAYNMRPEQRSGGVPPNWMVYVAVQNADEFARRAGELGGKVCAQAFDVGDMGRMAVLADPTEATFSVWQAKKQTVALAQGVDGSVCWADLSTSDAETAKRFYSDLFGWQIDGENDPSGYLHIKNGDQPIGGIQSPHQHRAGTPPHWLIYFLISDCNGSSAKAVDLGAQVLLEPMEIENVGRMAVLKDPQGAVFALFQPAPRVR
ncbi:MAG: VOC family protein [Acidobacteriaceae bacterium]|nr:VOC family protein [Acidobacteriaceae bacterium]MBV9295351.1 VOC family protein [Acidobacteriaceae bacterium]